MALLSKIGSFALNTSTGNQSITGVGFQPKVVLFFPTRVASDTSFAGSRWSFGAGVSSTLRAAASASSTDGVTTTAARSAHGNDRCIIIRQSNVSAYEVTADFVSQNTDGFTINILNAPASAYIVNYIALAGDDLQNATIGSFQTRVDVGQQSITGLGFSPDSVIMFDSTLSSTGPNLSPFTGNRPSIGFASKTTQGSVSGYTSHAVASTTTSRSYRRTRTDRSFTILNTSAGASLVSFDSDGFTLDFIEKSSTTATHVYYVAMKGASVNVGEITGPSSTSTQIVDTPGSNPKAVIFLSGIKINEDLILSNYRTTLGGASDSGQFNIINTDMDGGAATVATHALDRTVCYKTDDGNSTVVFGGNKGGGFSLSWTKLNIEPDQLLYMSFGELTSSNFLQFF